jgi:glycosyltransferase involved in cell wall biosynthesis
LSAPARGERSRPVVFVYPNSRRELARRIAAGSAPDTELLGQNHLAGLGIESAVHEPLIRPRGPAPLHRLLWNVRELAVPWQVDGSAVVVTPLAGLLPLAGRPRRRQRVVIVNYGLCTTWRRSGEARRRLLRASLSSAAAVVCLGAWQRKLLLEQTAIAPDRVKAVRLGVDADFFAAQPPLVAEPFVLAVGKDLARDYATLGEALRPLRVRAVIACLPRNVRDVRLPANVEARLVDPVELRTLYARASCVVVPQRRVDYPFGSEGGGLTALLEAMASARPTVVSDRPLLREYGEEGVTTLFVPPEEPEALAASIARLLAEDELRARLGANARARVEDGSTTRHFATGIAAVVDELGDR